MKKICLLFVAILAVNMVASAEGGDLDNQFYFRFGASIPTWKYRGYDGKDDFNNHNYADDWKRGGAIFEMGNIFMLNGIKLMDGMRIGLNVDYLVLNYNRFKSKDAQTKFTTFFWGAKFGPSFTYSPVDKIEFDAYVKFNAVWLSTYFAKPYKQDEGQAYWEDWGIGFFGPKLSVGLNARLSVLMIGVEYNPGFVKYNMWDDTNDELSDEYLGNAKDVDKDYTPTPCINITAGFSF